MSAATRRTAPSNRSHHTAGEAEDSMKGKRMAHTAAPRITAPMGSRVARALKMLLKRTSLRKL